MCSKPICLFWSFSARNKWNWWTQILSKCGFIANSSVSQFTFSNICASLYYLSGVLAVTCSSFMFMQLFCWRSVHLYESKAVGFNLNVKLQGKPNPKEILASSICVCQHSHIEDLGLWQGVWSKRGPHNPCLMVYSVSASGPNSPAATWPCWLLRCRRMLTRWRKTSFVQKNCWPWWEQTKTSTY